MTLPFAVEETLIDQAAMRLDIAGRLEGRNGALFMDVSAPKAEVDAAAGYVATALVGLHREIQDDDDLSDIEEALEDPLRAGDQHGIDEGCDIYRALLASRLKAILRLPDSAERMAELLAAGSRR